MKASLNYILFLTANDEASMASETNEHVEAEPTFPFSIFDSGKFS